MNSHSRRPCGVGSCTYRALSFRAQAFSRDKQRRPAATDVDCAAIKSKLQRARLYENGENISVCGEQRMDVARAMSGT